MAGLVAGTLLGSALQSWLRVDIIPIFVRPIPAWLCRLGAPAVQRLGHSLALISVLTKL